jgi:hypothetical protein
VAVTVGGEVAKKKVGREEVRLLGRHLAVAVVGVASCQVALEKDRHAFPQSGQELDLLKRSARWLFRELVAADQTPYLLPAIWAQGSRWSSWPGCSGRDHDSGTLDAAGAALVRAAGRGPRLASKARRYAAPVARLREAVAVVEEASRVAGLCRLVERVRGSGRTTLAVLSERERQAAGLDAAAWPFLAWGVRRRGEAPPPSGVG